jgi:hypothetical protein
MSISTQHDKGTIIVTTLPSPLQDYYSILHYKITRTANNNDSYSSSRKTTFILPSHR